MTTTMKNTLLLIVLCLCLNATVFGQNEFKGLWVVCDSTENCKDGPTPLCMRIADSTISYVMSLSTGVDSDILGIAYYKIEDSILKTVDTNYTGKVSTNEFQMNADGIALVDKHICIGCRYCMMACPYKARSFVHEKVENQKLTAPRGKGTVESCTMCVTRVDNGGIPACVEACTAENHNAMIFGDLNDPNSPISVELKKHGGKQLRPDLALNTGVRYQGL